MNRRQAITTLGSLAVLPRFNATPTKSPKHGKYGFLDPDRHESLRLKHGIFLRVYLNGEDVTGHCFAADDTEGYVKVYKLRNGQTYTTRENPNECAQETLYGSVEFRAISQSLSLGSK